MPKRPAVKKRPAGSSGRRKTAAMTKEWSAAIKQGQKQAQVVLDARKAIAKRRRAAAGYRSGARESAGLLLAEGDSLPPLNEQVVAGLIDERLRAAIVELASAVTHLCQESLNATVRW